LSYKNTHYWGTVASFASEACKGSYVPFTFTNGFINKSQKTPSKEIQKAKKIMEAYKNE